MSFDLQPSLKSELIVLRPLQEADREALFAVAADPLIWEQHPQRDRYQRPVFDRFFDKGLESKGALVALDAKTGTVIGASRYHHWDADAKCVTIGFTFLSRDCWGKGYNRHMKKLMLDHAFRAADTVFFHIGKDNWRSRTAVEKIGGIFVGDVQDKLADGSSNPSVIYQIQKKG